MKIVFFGTPFFAATNLKALIDNGHEIVAIVTAPDSRKGRGKKLKPTAVKEIGIEYNIPVLQPTNLKDEGFRQALEALNADIFVVVAFRMLPKSVWNLPPKGTINLHTSLLPNYRGAAPINWVLINGETHTGITTFFIDKQIDSGAIIQQEKVMLNTSTTAAELHNILMNNGSTLLINTLKNIEKENVASQEQMHTSAMKDAPKITKELCKINWNNSVDEIHNLIRGLSPFINKMPPLKDVAICPSAWFVLKDEKGSEKRIKVQYSKVVSASKEEHLSINTDNKSFFEITIKDKAISILNLQAEGKNPMTIQQFLQGNKINESFSIL